MSCSLKCLDYNLHPMESLTEQQLEHPQANASGSAAHAAVIDSGKDLARFAHRLAQGDIPAEARKLATDLTRKGRGIGIREATNAGFAFAKGREKRVAVEANGRENPVSREDRPPRYRCHRVPPCRISLPDPIPQSSK